MMSRIVAKPPAGLLRWLLRLPVVLYRLKLGWLLGERFVLLNHVGRKSGTVHQTVVEVVGHDTANDTYFIVSGWGYKANWYRNLIATPYITIQVGRRTLNVEAQTLPPDKAAQILRAYREEHPFAARELSRLMGLDIIDATSTALEQTVRESLPVIELRPRQAEADTH